MKSGSERLDNELSLDKLIKKVRKNNILMKKYFSGKNIKFEIDYDRKNILDLDEGDNLDESYLSLVESQMIMDSKFLERCTKQKETVDPISPGLDYQSGQEA